MKKYCICPACTKCHGAKGIHCGLTGKERQAHCSEHGILQPVQEAVAQNDASQESPSGLTLAVLITCVTVALLGIGAVAYTVVFG